MREIDAEVVPGLVCDQVPEVVQRNRQAIADLRNRIALHQRLLERFVLPKLWVRLLDAFLHLRELVQIDLPPVQPAVVVKREATPAVPAVDQVRLLRRGACQQQRAEVAVLFEMLRAQPESRPFIAVQRGRTADLVQLVPVVLPAALGRLRGGGLPALLNRPLHELLGEALAGRAGVVGKHQARPPQGDLLAQGGQRGLRVVVAAERGHRGDAVEDQRDRVEDALGNPQLLHAGEGLPGRLPPRALVAAAEGGLALAEALRAVDQPLPVADAGQRKAHRGAAQLQLRVPVVVLAVPAAHLLKVEAAVVPHVGVGGGVGVFRRGRVALAPGLEQVRVQILHVLLVAALLQPAAAQHPGGIRLGVELLLAAARAHALAQPALLLLELEVAVEAGGNVGVQAWIHGSLGKCAGKKSPSRPKTGMTEGCWLWSGALRGARVSRCWRTCPSAACGRSLQRQTAPPRRGSPCGAGSPWGWASGWGRPPRPSSHGPCP